MPRRFAVPRPALPHTRTPDFDLFDALMEIARLDASLTRRTRAPADRDFSRLARYLPGIGA